MEADAMSLSGKGGQLFKSVAVEAYALQCFFVLQGTQWLPSRELKRLQERKLKLLLEHAYNNVPYYHRLFRERRIKPHEVRSVADLARIPVLTRDVVRQRFSEFIARDSSRYWRVATATGGSTGEPLRFFIDVKSAAAGAAALWRGWGYAGYRFGDRVAVLAGLSLVPGREGFMKAAVKKAVRGMVSFPAINLRRELLHAYARQMVRFQPRFIRGYPSSIYFFADFLKEKRIEGICPHAVLTTAEMLLPHQRKLIEEVFRCSVFDGYGAFDGGTAAFECERHCGYHMAVEKSIMEFVDDNAEAVTEGEEGHIVATDLCNYAMPFIRYDTGDMGTYSNEACACGRGLPLMTKILGRTTDILKFKSGAVLSGPALTLIFKDFDIKQYQVVQTGVDSMIVKIVKGRSYGEKDSRKLGRILRDAVGSEVEVRLELVDSIQPAKSGKWKIVISQI